MGIYNTRAPQSAGQWVPGNATTASTISVTNAAAGVELVAAAAQTTPRFVTIYNDGPNTIHVLRGGTGAPTASNSSISLDPGFAFDDLDGGTRWIAISTGAASSVRVSLTPAVRL